MSLLSDIKAKRIEYMKARDGASATTLATVLGDAERVGKDDGNRESTDAEVQKVLQKFVGINKETIAAINRLAAKDPALAAKEIEQLLTENALIEQFLPKAKTGEDLENAIIEVMQEPDSGTLSEIMRNLKAKAERESFIYDGKEAAQIVKARTA